MIVTLCKLIVTISTKLRFRIGFSIICYVFVFLPLYFHVNNTEVPYEAVLFFNNELQRINPVNDKAQQGIISF